MIRNLPAQFYFLIILFIIIIIIMKLFQALSNIIVLQSSLWYVPVVRCEKSHMNSAAAAEDNSDNGVDRVLKSSSNDDRYPYSRNYVAIIEPDNFVSLDSNGGGLGRTVSNLEGGFVNFQGNSIVEFGNVFDPADIAIVNRFNGVQLGDIGLPLEAELVNIPGGTKLIGQRFAGNRQPKLPIPPGDKAYFFHGECVALASYGPGRESSNFDTFADGLVQLSHTCNLNLCLGGGGFDCIGKKKEYIFIEIS
jgi:hypothetical protein